MKMFHLVYPLILSFFMLAPGCEAQTSGGATGRPSPKGRSVGGPCDGCEIMWVGMPATVRSIDTSKGWSGAGRKLVISGIVLKRDGRTPAPGVLLYYWQTDNNGYYSAAPDLPEKAARHGHLRGWVRTDEKGHYAIYTIRPVPYPNEDIPAHIHMLVKEPSVGNEYYIDDILFEDDNKLTKARRSELEQRGGDGIVRVNKDGPVQKATRNIILGLNIPGYPGAAN